MRVTVLGSGTSRGVPMIGCKCEVCLSPNPKNKRFRPSVTVQTGDKTILVDTTPEQLAQIAYAASALGARRLLEEAGGFAVANLLRDLGDGVDFETAFLHRIQRSFTDFQATPF